MSLQRNNAMAVVDIPNKELIDIFALGSKDHNVAGNGLDGSDVDGAISNEPRPGEEDGTFWDVSDHCPLTFELRDGGAFSSTP